MNLSPASLWRGRRAEIRHGLRITAAGVFSYVLAQALDLPQGYWAVFTAVLVVQASVGGSVKAAVDRLIGTVLGAVYGGAIATLIPHTSALSTGAALVIALAPLTLAAAMSPSFRVAPVTAVILLLGNAGVTQGPLLAAVDRTVEVILGGMVGLLASLLVLPARGPTVVGVAANAVAQRMANLLQTLCKALLGAGDLTDADQQHKAIRSGLDALDDATVEANRERRALLSDEMDTAPILRTLRRIYHDFILIGRIAATPLGQAERERLAAPLDHLCSATVGLLRGLGPSFVKRLKAPSLDEFNDALSAVVRELAAPGGSARLIPLGFAFEQMQLNFRDLARRADEFARDPDQRIEPSI